MFARLILKLAILTASILLLAACDMLNVVQPAPTQVPAEAHTQAAETIIAQVTQAAPSETPLPSPTPPPATFTLTPTSIGANTATPALDDTQAPAETSPARPTDTPESNATPSPQPELGDFTVVLRDDFSGDTGWYTNQGEDFGFEYAQGGYRIYVNLSNTPIWSIRQRDYADVRLEVDVASTDGPESGYYGVVCRFDQEERDYYALVISPDGTYGIAKSENNEFEFLDRGTAPEGVIDAGQATNRVRGDCLGDTLTLYANGQELLQVVDDDFESGSIGLIAGTRSEPGFAALFDNLVILQP